MINLGYPPTIWGGNPDPIWLLDPEEGTLQEYAIRHWFTRNIYAGLTYYEMDMDNEIYWGPDPAYPLVPFSNRNLNVPLVSHSGLELEAFARLTPRWTLKGNFTKQKVIFRSNWQPFDAQRRTTEDKWLTENPAQMVNLSLAYENKEWGFSALLSYHYVGTRFMINDIFNEWPDLETAKWGDIAFSQTFFDDVATLYFGVNNVSDLQYALQGTLYGKPLWYPNAGQTFYFGVKANTDFDRMRLPTAADLSRMQQRLYGAASEGLGAMANIRGWIRGSSTPFGREGR
jgi:iron complex outermembrane receptor protein